MRVNKAIFNVVILIILTAFFFGAYLLENLGVQYSCVLLPNYGLCLFLCNEI